MQTELVSRTYRTNIYSCESFLAILEVNIQKGAYLQTKQTFWNDDDVVFDYWSTIADYI